MSAVRRFPTPPRVVHVENCMGTVFTIDIRDPGDWAEPVLAVVAGLHDVDAVFSTYRNDSAISRLGRGEIRIDACPRDVLEVLALCAEVNRDSDGYFTIFPDRTLDPSALVKGWAIERASRLLREHGSANHAVSGGGDMQLVGEAAPGRPWQVGIADPQRPGELVAIVAGRDLAIATSGTAERGTHIVNPFTGRPATELASLTVIGPRLTLVDAYATAGFAMGSAARGWVENLHGYDSIGVTADGERWRTSGVRPSDELGVLLPGSSQRDSSVIPTGPSSVIAWPLPHSIPAPS